MHFKTRGEAEKALLYMDGVGCFCPSWINFHNQACWLPHLEIDAFVFFVMQAQIDGNVVKARFTLPPRQKASPPPKAVAPKRDAPRTDNAGAEVEKDGPKRPRECICLIFVEHFFVLYLSYWY